MVLIVIGDVEPDIVFSTARSVLPDEPGEIPVRDYGQEETLGVYSERYEKQMEVSSPLFMIGYKLDRSNRGPDFLRKNLTGELALRLIAGGTSHLYSRLYEEGRINKSFGCGVETATDRMHALFYGESDDPDAVFEAIKAEIHQICSDGFKSDYFSRIKRAYSGKIIRALNSFEGIAYSYADGFFHGYDSFESVDTLAAIKQDDVLTFIRSELTDARAAIAVISPSKNNSNT